MNNMNNEKSIAIKAKTETETRRFRLTPISYAQLVSTLVSLGLVSAESMSTSAVNLSWKDSENDSITFSSDRELTEAIELLASDDAVLTIFVTAKPNPNPAAVAPSVAAPSSAPAPVLSISNNNKEIWAAVPIWRKHKLASKFKIAGIAGIVHDVAVFEQLPDSVRAWLTKQHTAAAAASASAPSAAPMPPQSDEEMWLGAPAWFRAKVVAKFVPEMNADTFLAFQALPDHVKLRVRARCVQHSKKVAPHPPVDAVADLAMWTDLPDFVRLKIASKAAKAGIPTADPHSFAVFQALPAWRQEKVRRKVAKHAKKAHKQQQQHQKLWWRAPATLD